MPMNLNKILDGFTTYPSISSSTKITNQQITGQMVQSLSPKELQTVLRVSDSTILQDLYSSITQFLENQGGQSSAVQISTAQDPQDSNMNKHSFKFDFATFCEEPALTEMIALLILEASSKKYELGTGQPIVVRASENQERLTKLFEQNFGGLSQLGLLALKRDLQNSQ